MTQPARPFRNSDVEVMIKFYPAAPGALGLPFASNLYVNSWDDDWEKLYQDYPGCIGEGDQRNNLSVPIPGSGRGHVCGSSTDFEQGGLYDPAAPPVVYDVSGLPLCCLPPVDDPGGFGVGGAPGFPVAPFPGSTCLVAGGPLQLGTWYQLNFAGGFPNHWYFTFVNAANPIRFRGRSLNSGQLVAYTLSRDDCSTIERTGTLSAAGTDITYTSGTFLDVRLHLTATGAGFPYLIRFDQ